MADGPSLTGSGGRGQRTVQEEPLDAILSPELDKMVTDGEFQLQHKPLVFISNLLCPFVFQMRVYMFAANEAIPSLIFR